MKVNTKWTLVKAILCTLLSANSISMSDEEEVLVKGFNSTFAVKYVDLSNNSNDESVNTTTIYEPLNGLPNTTFQKQQNATDEKSPIASLVPLALAVILHQLNATPEISTGRAHASQRRLFGMPNFNQNNHNIHTNQPIGTLDFKDVVRVRRPQIFMKADSAQYPFTDLIDSYQSLPKRDYASVRPDIPNNRYAGPFHSYNQKGDFLNTRLPPPVIKQFNQPDNNVAKTKQSEHQELSPPVPSRENQKPSVAPLESRLSVSSVQLAPRCDRFTRDICLDDFEYPSSAMLDIIFRKRDQFDYLYAEVKERGNQVDGLSRKDEEKYNYKHYYGAQDSSNAKNINSRDYGPEGGFVCPSEIVYAKPKRARNPRGEWKVIVNVGDFTQTVRMEKCLMPGSKCSYVSNHFVSNCLQIYNYQRLVVFDKKKGLYTDIFRIPSGCSCYIRGYAVNFPTENEVGKDDGFNISFPDKNSFSNTLWSVLAGSLTGSSFGENDQFVNQVHQQLSLLQQLKKYSQFTNGVTPSEVLQELLREEDNDLNSKAPMRHRLPQPQNIRSNFPVPVNHRPGIFHKNLEKPVRNQRPPLLFRGRKRNRNRPRPYVPGTSRHPENYFTENTFLEVPKDLSYTDYINDRPNKDHRDKTQNFNEYSTPEKEITGFRPLLNPPVPRSSSVPDFLNSVPSTPELIAAPELPFDTMADKSEVAIKLSATRDGDNTSSQTGKEEEKKINFSYHPILDYISSV
ncbi:uncharacterized protein LOC143228084 [Tachypleus tridentatus]|uniref:uncharacterized protein LOC143228084 n=1 Tax=Tachypleus tridentatus TaxID=6853 RepID=UPI003FD1071B